MDESNRKELIKEDLYKAVIGKKETEARKWFRAKVSVVKDLTTENSVQKIILQKNRTKRSEGIKEY